MTDTKKMLKEFLAPKVLELDNVSVAYEIEGDTIELSLSEGDSEQGSAGLTGYKGLGYAVNKDANVTYSPTRARGAGRNLGMYHQAFLESQAFQDGWGKIEQG